MKLKEYLSENNLTHENFSQQVGVSRVQITKIINKYVSPSAKVMKKIKEATDGKVSYEDLIEDQR